MKSRKEDEKFDFEEKLRDMEVDSSAFTSQEKLVKIMNADAYN
jgi:hypothetical protein